MGKIVKLKNKKTGVRVYPVTATKAVVDADSGERLNDTLQNKVEEAPMDGAQYVRKNGGWEVAEVAMDPNEICRISLKSNQGDADNASLNGASVKVENTVTGEVIHEGTWDGNEIELSIPGATKYKVTVGDVADYATPEAKEIEAVSFSSRDLIFVYNTEVLTVNVNGLASGFTVTIKDGSGSTIATQTSVSASYKIPFGVSYSISASDVLGYRTPESGNYTSGSASRTINLAYEARTWEDNPGLGVFIEDTEGHLWTSENWSNALGYTANSIVIKSSTMNVRMALSWRYNTSIDNTDLRYSNHLASTPVEEHAKYDSNGYANTNNLLEVFSEDGYAAKYCSSFVFPNGMNGFLPAAGQALLFPMNREAIIACYLAVGTSYPGDNLITSTYKELNTTYNVDSFWIVSPVSETLMDGTPTTKGVALPFATY